MISCEATGPDGDRLLSALEGGDRRGSVEGLGHALPDEDDGEDDGDRQQEVQDRPGQVDPEVADRLASCGGRGRG